MRQQQGGERERDRERQKERQRERDRERERQRERDTERERQRERERENMHKIKSDREILQFKFLLEFSDKTFLLSVSQPVQACE